MNLSKKPYRYLILAAKLIVFALAIGYVYFKVFHGEGTDNLIEGLSKGFTSTNSLLFILVAVVLMPFNWGVEALKWKILVKPVVHVPPLRAIIATLSGATISLFTPNRIGGFLGRIVYLEPEYRMKASFASVFGNYCQLMITILFGTVGMGYAILKNMSLGDGTISQEVIISFCLASVAISIVLLYLFFTPRAIMTFIFRFQFLMKYTRHAKVLKAYSRKDLYAIFFLSAVRYCVFTIQFFMVLRAFEVSVGFIEGFMLISLVYLILAVVPSLVLGNLGIREMAVVIIFGALAATNQDLVGASLTIWAINLVIPALIGSLCILWAKFNFSRIKS